MQSAATGYHLPDKGVNLLEWLNCANDPLCVQSVLQLALTRVSDKANRKLKRVENDIYRALDYRLQVLSNQYHLDYHLSICRRL